MKCLCVCQYGHSRSVALTRVLHRDKVEAAAVGRMTAPAALAVLAEWADVIAVLDRAFVAKLPAEHRHKVTDNFHVGPDVWSNPYSRELDALLVARYEAYRASGGAVVQRQNTGP